MRTLPRDAPGAAAAVGARRRRRCVEAEGGLAAAHREVDVRQDAGVEQRAVQVAAGVVDAVALAERIEVVALARVHAARERERVEDAAAIGDACARSRPRASSASRKPTSNSALWITSSAPSTKARNSSAMSANAGCVAQEFVRDAVHRERARVDVAPRASGSDASCGRSAARCTSSTQPISMMRWPSASSRPVVSVSRTIWRTVRRIPVRAPAEPLPSSSMPRFASASARSFSGMAGVAAHPVPFDVVRGRERVEALPEVLVLHRLAVGGPPVAALPVGKPGRDAFAHILRIRVDGDAAAALQRLERADRGRQLHAVVRRVGLAAESSRSRPR